MPGSAIAGSARPSTAGVCDHVVRASRGKSRRRAITAMTIISDSAIKPAGTSPPRNIAPTEALAISA